MNLKFFFISSCILINSALFAETLTWQDCVKYTKANNQTIKISQEKINQAETNISITKKNLAPNLDFSMNNSQNKENNSTNAYNLALKKTIFDNKQNDYAVKSLEKTLAASKYDFLNTSAQIRFQLRTAFINLFYAQESLKLAEDINQIRKNNYELVQMKYASGTENKGSLLLAEAQFVESETAVKKAKLDIISMQKALTSIMGNVDYSSFTVKSSFDLKTNPNDSPDFQLILSSSPVLKSLEQQKESQEFNLKLESLKILPSVDVSASIGKSDNSFLSNNDLARSVGISLSVPIFAGNVRKDKIKNANSLYNQALLTITSNKNSIFNSLQTSWINFEESIFDVNTKNKYLKAYEKRSEITRAKYSIGLSTFDDWTIIEDNLISAKKAYLDAEIQTLQKEAAWIQTKGGSLDYE